MPADFPIVALIAAHNEADVIAQVVEDLIRQGIQVYLLDDASTDGTVAAVEPFRGRGLVGIERYPGESGAPGAAADVFGLEAIVRRKEALARELDARWFISHDADEFRESPWPGVPLADAIRHVDAAGFNAIDFELLDFWPTHDRFRAGDDVRLAFRHYTLGRPWDKLQIRCWKKLDVPLDLASSGGHEASFPGRRVFPLRFLLRHYPIRGQAHGERKVLRERLPRFVPAERARGWHVQYEGVGPGHRFIRDPAELVLYDPLAVRLHLALRHRGVEELEETVLARERMMNTLQRQVRAQSLELGRLAAAREEAEQRLRAVLASRSWRWTAPLRAAFRLLASILRPRATAG
jgi:glycosyltransferase involved in cell wall biosynthesis